MDNRISGGTPILGFSGPSFARSSSEDSVSNSAMIDVNAVKVSSSSTVEQKQTAQQQLEKVIRAMQGPEKTFEFSVHEETHTVMVKVFNKETGDLIREIPQEKLLDVAASLMELTGLIIDKKA